VHVHMAKSELSLDTGSGCSQNVDSGFEKTKNPAGVDSSSPDP